MGLRPDEELAVHPGDVASRRVPLVEVPELDGEERGLERVEPAVRPDRFVLVLRSRPTVVRDDADPVRQRSVVRDDRAAVAEGAEVLPRIEAEAAGDAER